MKYKWIGSIIIGCIITLIVGITIVEKFNDKNNEYFIRTIKNQFNFFLASYDTQELEKELYRQLNNVTSRSQMKKIYTRLGYFKFFSGEYEQSNEYFLRSLEIDGINSDEVQVTIYMGISNNYYMLHQVEESDEYYKKAQNLTIEMQNENLLAYVYRTRARLYKNTMSQLDKAFNLVNLSLYLETGELGEIECNILLAEIAMLKGDYKEMIDYLKQAWIIAKEYQYSELIEYILCMAGIGYYLDGQYEVTIRTFEYLVDELSFSNEFMLTYVLCNSYAHLEEYDSSINVLNRYKPEGDNKTYTDLSEAMLLINEGSYFEAKRILDTIEADSTLGLWKRLLELKLKFIFEPEEDLLVEYQLLLGESRSTLQSSVDSFFIYDCMLEYVSNRGLEDMPILEDFNARQDEVSMTELFQIIGLKTSSRTTKQKNDIKLVFGISGIILSGIVYHVIYVKKLKRQIKLQEQKDILTDTLIYERIDEEIKSLIGSNRPIQLMLFDIEAFQKYNDTYGYLAGNQVLKQVADLLKSEFSDGRVTRYNGHQFLVVLFNNHDCLDKRMNRAVELFQSLRIPVVTDLSNGNLLIRVSGSCCTLTKHFQIDDCVKEIKKQLQLIKRASNGNYIN